MIPQIKNRHHLQPSGRGRPRGTQRESLTHFVSANGQFTLRDVARSLGVDVRQADQVLRRAVASREIRPAGTTRLADVKRPVLVYEPASDGRADAMSGAQALALQMRGWGR